MKSIVCQVPLKPYTHSLGKAFILPGSNLQITTYPSKIFIHLLEEEKKPVAEIELLINGPVINFNWELDFKKKQANLSYTHENSLLTLIFYMDIDQFCISCKRSSTKEVLLRLTTSNVQETVKEFTLEKGKDIKIHLKQAKVYENKGQPHLFLGSNKAQNLDQMLSREDLKEYLPLFFAYGAAYHNGKDKINSYCYNRLEQADKSAFSEAFFQLYKEHFTAHLSPRVKDEDYQAIVPNSHAEVELTSHMALFSQLYKLIERCFVSYQNGTELTVLPSLPKELASGKLIGLKLAPEISISIEWSKKKLKLLEIFCHENAEFVLRFSKKLKTFRLYTSSKKNAQKLSNGDLLKLSKGTRYFFDLFES